MMNLEPLAEALRLLEQSRITEFEVEDVSSGQLLRVRRHPRPLIPATPAASKAAPLATEAPAPAVLSIEARWVGRFYFSSEAPVPGAQVKEDEILGGVESMRLMNAVAAPAAGHLTAVHVEEGQPVEYGQVLFEMLPDQT